MPRVCYLPREFTSARQQIIDQANAICAEYASKGFTLTLRQLYYQFVARDLLPNRQSEYKRLGEILNDARLAGELDWSYLIDRTRNLVRPATWSSPTELMEAAASQYKPDRWADQNARVEVWIEKDAGIGVIDSVCASNDVPYFSCRGYTSASELWSAAQRIRRQLDGGQDVVILHIGDHDPSGLDMSRDIEARLSLFIRTDQRERGTLHGGSLLTVQRIALNYDQVERYSPPPNPAKTTDARYQRYVEETGLRDSWELDALDPEVLQALIQGEIDAWRDAARWAAVTEQMETARALLRQAAGRWQSVSAFLADADEERD